MPVVKWAHWPIGKFCVITFELLNCHSALSTEAKSVEEAINRFHASSVNLVVKHQKKIIQQQFALKRVADCMIDLYTASACISRASAAVTQQKENADLEVQLAKIYVNEALGRVNESIRQIEG